jgi:hypothetical protein
MVFEMPEEISGQNNRDVLCQGRVIRCREQEGEEKPAATEGSPKTATLAASIVDYKFIR